MIPSADPSQAIASNRRSAGWFPLILFVAGAFAIFFQLGQPAINSANEAQRGTPPIEMLQTGDFIIPTLNRQVYIWKPPLLYWAIAGLYSATGVIDEFTARAPTAFCGLLLLMGVYLFTQRTSGEVAARWAAGILLAMPFFLRRAQVSDLDMPLALACFLAIVAMWSALESRGRARWALATAAGVALGAGIMLKGPVPLLFLLPAWAVHAVVHGRRDPATIRSALVWTMLFFVGDWIISSVHLLIKAENVPSLVSRALSPPYGLIGVLGLWLWLAWQLGCADRARRIGVLVVVVLVGAAVTLPWIIAVVMRLGLDYTSLVLSHEAIQRTYSATEINSGTHWFYLGGLTYWMAPWSLLAPLLLSARLRPMAPQWLVSTLTAIVSITVFSLIAGKEHDYILPAYPFAAIAFGGLLAAASQRIDGWPARYMSWWTRLMQAILGAGTVGFAAYATWRYRVNAVTLFEIWIGAAAALTALWRYRSAPRSAWGVGIATVVLATQIHIIAGTNTGGTESMEDIALAMRELSAKGLVVEASEVRPSTAFYLQTPISVMPDLQTVATRLQGTEPYYYMCRPQELDGLRRLLGEEAFQVLAGYYTSARYVLIGNRPLPAGVGGNLQLEELQKR